MTNLRYNQIGKTEKYLFENKINLEKSPVIDVVSFRLESLKTLAALLGYHVVIYQTHKLNQGEEK